MALQACWQQDEECIWGKGDRELRHDDEEEEEESRHREQDAGGEEDKTGMMAHEGTRGRQWRPREVSSIELSRAEPTAVAMTG